MPSRTTRRCGPCDGDCTPCEMHGFCHLCEVEKLTAAVEERDALLENVLRNIDGYDAILGPIRALLTPGDPNAD